MGGGGPDAPGTSGDESTSSGQFGYGNLLGELVQRVRVAVDPLRLRVPVELVPDPGAPERWAEVESLAAIRRTCCPRRR